MLQLLTEENKLLRQRSKRVSKIDDTVRNISASLIDTMILNNGVGIAAPQCGILKQIIIVLVESEPKVFINPEIISVSDETDLADEGCLSIPSKFVTKYRRKSITLKYRDLKGHPHIETYDGFAARVLQHEIDHLHGVLMTDE